MVWEILHPPPPPPDGAGAAGLTDGGLRHGEQRLLRGHSKPAVHGQAHALQTGGDATFIHMKRNQNKRAAGGKNTHTHTLWILMIKKNLFGEMNLEF